MNLQESIRRILKEESLKQTLLDEIMRSGIRDTANIMSVDVKELLDMVGITGTKEDMIFLIKSFTKSGSDSILIMLATEFTLITMLGNFSFRYRIFSKISL